MICFLLAVLLPGLYQDQAPERVDAIKRAGITRVYSPAAHVAAWKAAGMEVLDSTALGQFTVVPAPTVRMEATAASATRIPWINANGWRYQRGLKRAFYKNLPQGSAPMAAAEAFAYGVDAVLQPAAKDLDGLLEMVTFLGTIVGDPMPPLANIGVLDDGTPVLGEVMNLLSRRNLLYRVVTKPDSSLDLNVKVGSEQFPVEAARNPSDFAARVREKLQDEKRLLRIYGSSVGIGYLTGNDGNARLFLLNYLPRPVTGLQVRIKGNYSVSKAHVPGRPNAVVKDPLTREGGTEFTMPEFQHFAVVDLVKGQRQSPR
jgi:hypothetical protein